MSTQEGYSSPETESPIFDLTLDGEVYSLTWHNTLLRTFLFGHGEFDHLLHQLPDGKYLFIFLDSEDGNKLRQQLEEMRYPIRTDPILDEETIEMYVKRQASQLENELAQEFG